MRARAVSLWRLLVLNPVMIREMTAGMRERRIFILQTVFLSLLSIVAYLMILGSLATGGSGYSPDVGQNIVRGLFVTQWLLVVLIAPSLACGAVSGEREKKTYEMLVASLLSPAEIVWGKLSFALSYILLLILSSVPVTAVVFFLGGVSPEEILARYLVIFGSGCVASLVALFFSARETKTTGATNLSYLVTVLALIVALIVFANTWNKDLYDLLFGTIDYHGIHVWYLVPYAVTLLWFLTLVFTKARGFIKMTPEVVLTLQKSFQYAYAAMLAFFSMFCVVQFRQPAADVNSILDAFWGWLLLLDLFFMGTFLSPPPFQSKRDDRRYERHLNSRRWFFPFFFMATAAIPLAFFHGEGVEMVPLRGALAVMGIFCLAFASISSSLSRLFGGRLSRPVIYYALFIFAVGVPLFHDWAQIVHEEAPSLMSLYYVGPLKAMHSVWVNSDQSEILVNHQLVPLWAMSLAFYGLLSVVCLLLTLVKRARRASRPPARSPEHAS